MIPVIKELLLGLVVDLVVTLTRFLQRGVHVGVGATIVAHYVLVLVQVATALSTLFRVTLLWSAYRLGSLVHINVDCVVLFQSARLLGVLLLSLVLLNFCHRNVLGLHIAHLGSLKVILDGALSWIIAYTILVRWSLVGYRLASLMYQIQLVLLV